MLVFVELGGGEVLWFWCVVLVLEFEMVWVVLE